MKAYKVYRVSRFGGKRCLKFNTLADAKRVAAALSIRNHFPYVITEETISGGSQVRQMHVRASAHRPESSHE